MRWLELYASKGAQTVLRGQTGSNARLATRSHIAEGRDGDVRGWHEHTRSVGEVAQTLLGVAPSASAISRLNQTLTQQFEAWRQRPLQEHWRILYLDGIHFSIRHGDKADSTIILTALGVDLAGNKEVLARLSLC